MEKSTKSNLMKSNGRSMNSNLLKIKVGDILRALIVALLSITAFIGRDIRNQQVDVSQRLHKVELNQAKIMTVLGIEPYSSQTQIDRFLASFSQ